MRYQESPRDLTQTGDINIAKIDVDNQSYLLRHAIPSLNMDNLGCVNVQLGEDSAYFDNLKYGGEPQSIDEILAEDKLDQTVTVVGWQKFWVNSDNDNDPYYPFMQYAG